MPKVDVLGVKIDALTKDELLDEIRTRLQGRRLTFIVTPYSESIVAAQKDTEFRNILNSADIALPDGIGVLWAASFLKQETYNTQQVSGFRFQVLWRLIKSLLSIISDPKSIRDPIPEKISGSEFVWDLAELASKNNYSIFLLGGYGDTADLAGERLKEKFPNLKIAGTASPVIARSEATKQSREREITSLPLAMTEKLIQKINSSGADFLFVALSPIRQEKWIHQNLPKLSAKLAIGLGGTFDYLAQKRPPAPKFWAQRGLEWLWRLFTQPWRVGRILKGISGLIYYSLKKRPRN